MGTRDPRIDAYIAKSAPFARPILTHLRKLVHEACPDVEEGLKWSSPHWGYHGIMCGAAGFKAHVTFGFWKGSLVVDPKDDKSTEAMGSFGRITRLEDLPPDRVIKAYVKKAAELNASGVKLPRPVKHAPRKKFPMPKELKAALAERKHAKARAAFERMSPSHQYEYIEWIAEAKTAPTRERRLDTTLEWLAEGKSRNWKYERKKQ